ncbi:YrhB domain-containing protein [Streptomyces sp. NPDC001604]|uniref:YrhB domain-containing protein n=1 Tax=Streptomyces sp. NPDC001604 TaxID=3364593 RepID=UPI003678A164
MAVVDVKEHELAWIISWQSEEFVRTRNSEFMLLGNGPYLVDPVDGGLHPARAPVPLLGHGEEDVGATVAGMGNALHAGPSGPLHPMLLGPCLRPRTGAAACHQRPDGGRARWGEWRSSRNGSP